MRQYYQRAPIYILISFVVVILGFSTSYFARILEIESVYHFHAVPAILWFIVLIIQPILYNRSQIIIHRIVGLASLIVAFLVFCGTLLIVDRMLMVSFDRMPINTPYQFTFSSISLGVGFLLFVGLAYINRKNIHLHSRYMISTVFFAMIPGLTRFFNKIHLFALDGRTLSWFTAIIAIFILILYDHKKGKVYLPYLIALLWISLTPILFTSIHQWDLWRDLIDAYRLP